MDKNQVIWNEEHKNPQVLKQMDSDQVSSGVQLFWEWLKENNQTANLAGLEMGCGKSRNSLWLAKQDVAMTAFDSSTVAIEEAQKRTKKSQINVNFLVQDATKLWPWPDETFDFFIDCFASTDIEGYERRLAAYKEATRVLKTKGYYFLYTLSPDDQFHQAMIREYPASEVNSFLHPQNGKFEKVFSEQELDDFYQDFKCLEKRRIEKIANFFGQEYPCKHWWIIFQKL